MSFLSVKTRLALLQEYIPVIRKEYAQAPEMINVSDMPLFINLTGRGNPDYVSEGDFHNLETRIYSMRLYVLPVALGIPGEGERLVEPLIETINTFFSARPSLGGLENIFTAYLIGDSGIIQLPYQAGGDLYIGCDFTLQVKELLEFSYAKGE
jgi:hypothetical protein